MKRSIYRYTDISLLFVSYSFQVNFKVSIFKLKLSGDDKCFDLGKITKGLLALFPFVCMC